MALSYHDRSDRISVDVPLTVGAAGALLWIIGELIAIAAPLSSVANQVVGVALVLVAVLPVALVIAQGASVFLLGYFAAALTAGGFFTIGLINFFTQGGGQMMEAMEASPVFTVAGVAYLIGPGLLAVSMLLNGRYSRILAAALLPVLALIGAAATIPLEPTWNGVGNIALCLILVALAVQAKGLERQRRADPS